MQFTDIIYQKKNDVAKIIINRPEALNAFRGQTGAEMAQALEDASNDRTVGVVVLSGAGGKAFCVGGDTKEQTPGGRYSTLLQNTLPKVHRLIRTAPKPVIAAVNGYAIGGGHVLHLICDLTIASENSVFGQVGPAVGSFDAGFGTAYLARMVGEKKAREIWFLCRRYTAREALEMGLVNKVVPPERLEEEVDAWCQEILDKSPLSLEFLKLSFNADSDHLFGQEAWSFRSVMLYYETAEADEGRKAFLEKRKPNFRQFRK